MSPNNIHHCNYFFACHIFSVRVMSRPATALPQRLPFDLSTFKILKYTQTTDPRRCANPTTYEPFTAHPPRRIPRLNPPKKAKTRPAHRSNHLSIAFTIVVKRKTHHQKIPFAVQGKRRKKRIIQQDYDSERPA